jgi:single-strand binding protein
MLNRVNLMGRLVADPDLRQTPNGVSVTSFRIAVDRDYSKDGKQQTDFIDIVAWRQTADFVARYFAKGRMIAVDGAIQTRNYKDKQGNKRTAVEVVADSVYFADSKPNTNIDIRADIDVPDGAADFSEMTADSDDLPFSFARGRR